MVQTIHSLHTLSIYRILVNVIKDGLILHQLFRCLKECSGVRSASWSEEFFKCTKIEIWKSVPTKMEGIPTKIAQDMKLHFICHFKMQISYEILEWEVDISCTNLMQSNTTALPTVVVPYKVTKFSVFVVKKIFLLSGCYLSPNSWWCFNGLQCIYKCSSYFVYPINIHEECIIWKIFKCNADQSNTTTHCKTR